MLQKMNKFAHKKFIGLFLMVVVIVVFGQIGNVELNVLADNGNIDNDFQKELYEAEDAVLYKAIVDAKHLGYTGTGFVDYNPNEPGGSIEWTVEVPSEGEYVLEFRYACGAAEGRPAEIKVNGEVVNEALAFESTGEWTNWNTTYTTALLKAGANTILATATGPSGGANIDSLTICTPEMLQSIDTKVDVVEVSEILGEELFDKLAEQGLLVKDEQDIVETTEDDQDIEIVSADAFGTNILLVTLDSLLEQFDINDIKIGAGGSWMEMTTELREVAVSKVALGKNKSGNTVLVYQLGEPLDQGMIKNKETVVFTGDLEEAIIKAENLVSWQMDHGGWTKSMDEEYEIKWDGVQKRSKQLGPDGETELGTIDNDATVKEIRYIASVYRETGEEEFKASVQKGMDFLLTMQYPTGGWPQTYPERGKEGERIQYSNFVTFNDDAMINVMQLMDDILNKKYPFDTDIIDMEYYPKIQDAVDKGIEYILKSQIKVNGKLTAWCAQHDPVTYEPMYARSYEHPSISGSESVGIVKFLMSRHKQTEEIKNAVDAALAWFEESKVEGLRFDKNDPEGKYFVEDPSSTIWYRFYDIKTNKPIFSGRDGIIKDNIADIEEERRNNYSWSGTWPKQLLEVAKKFGYYENKVYVEVVNNLSTNSAGNTLQIGDVKMVTDKTLQLEPITITVDKTGKGDFVNVQDAIDSVPQNNAVRTKIFIKNGVYKEEINIPNTKPYISLIGESADKTILTYDNYSGKKRDNGSSYGTSGSASTYIYGNDFIAENITFENSFDEKSVDVKDKQAVAVYASGDRMIFRNCRFIGNQDTLYVRQGTQYFNKCYIEGDVDFIFGASRAVFDDCDIFSVDRGSSTNNGYITAASTPISQKYGYLFVNCRIKSDAAEGTVYLGRPWHPGGDPQAVASVLFKNCELGAHINPEGWTDMSGFSADDARFYEYNNTGAGAAVNESRRQLSDEQAEAYTIENVLNGWNPKSE